MSWYKIQKNHRNGKEIGYKPAYLRTLDLLLPSRSRAPPLRVTRQKVSSGAAGCEPANCHRPVSDLPPASAVRTFGPPVFWFSSGLRHPPASFCLHVCFPEFSYLFILQERLNTEIWNRSNDSQAQSTRKKDGQKIVVITRTITYKGIKHKVLTASAKQNFIKSLGFVLVSLNPCINTTAVT